MAHVVVDRFFVQHRASRTTIQRKTNAHNQTDLLYLSWNSAIIASAVTVACVNQKNKLTFVGLDEGSLVFYIAGLGGIQACLHTQDCHPSTGC